MSDPIDRAAEEFTRRFQHYDGYRSEARQADLLTVFKSGVQWAESQQAAHDAAVAAKALRDAAEGLAAATEGEGQVGTSTWWSEATRDAYSLAVEEAADALRARADRIEASDE